MIRLLSQNPVTTWLDGLSAPLLFTLIVVVAAFFAYTLERLAIAVLLQWTKRTKTEVDDVLVRALHPGLMIGVLVGTVWLALRYARMEFDPLTLLVINNVGRSLLIVAFGVGVVRLAAGLLRMPGKKNPRWFPLSTIGVRLASAVLWIMVGMILLNQYGIEIGPVIATLGVATLAVGLALGPTLQNFFAGLWIQAGETLRPGHFVRLEAHKLEGFIEEVGWRTTRIRTLPGNMVIVPNHELSQTVLTNYSLPAERMGTSITVVTGFEADPDHVVRVLMEEVQALAKEVPYVLTDPAPAVRLNQRVDNGWEFWCGFWVAHYWDQFNAKGLMFARIRTRFLNEGIRLALPIQEEYHVPTDRIDVRRSIVSAPIVNGTAGPPVANPASPTARMSDGDAD